MPASNHQLIEKIYLLKLAALPKSDVKWLFKKLKISNKYAYEYLRKKYHDVKKYNITTNDFEYIFNELNLSKYFEKNDIEKKIDALNDNLYRYQDDVTENYSIKDLLLFVYCDDALRIKRSALSQIQHTQDYINGRVRLECNPNEKLNAKIVNYLYDKYLATEL